MIGAERPPELFDRVAEWNDLNAFVAAAQPVVRLGIVSGRRRFGKSFLLRRLVEATGGLYHQALEQERLPALERFAEDVAGLYPTPPPLAFSGWEQALRHAVEVLGGNGRSGPQVLVIDEYPYISRTSPELDSTVQAVLDEAKTGELGRRLVNPVSIVLCGSAMSVMTDPLSGSSPLRGRASLDLSLEAFDYRQAAGYWGISNAETAFLVHSIVGGAAGYRDLTSAVPVPDSTDSLADWLAATVLNPSHALFREDEYLLREDPTVTKEALYYSLLKAIAAGTTSQGAIASAIGKKATDIIYPLDVLTRSGFVTKDQDLLLTRRAVYRVADPIVRFHELITRRYQEHLEDRRPAEVWARAADTFRSQIVGPHFEAICREWTARYAAETTFGGEIGRVRSLQVNDPASGRYELDVAATTAATVGNKAKTIQVVGEAKATGKALTLTDLHKLESATQRLGTRKGVSLSPTVKLLLFSAAGFDRDLTGQASDTSDLELIDLERLYAGS